MSAEAMRVPANHSTADFKTQPNDRNHRLMLYSTAALAAGVSVMALAQPAESEVVITRKKVPVPVSSYFFPPPKPVFISLNNDGVNDFSFSLSSFAYHSDARVLFVRPLEGGAVMGKETPGVNGFSNVYGSVVKRGGKIGPSAHFSSRNGVPIEHELHWFNSSSESFFKTYGNFGNNPANTYLGVKFLINGETHYGWVRLTVTSGADNINATITAYAYETEANKAILAGIPEGSKDSVRIIDANGPSLGALAAGADGLSSWRAQQAPAH